MKKFLAVFLAAILTLSIAIVTFSPSIAQASTPELKWSPVFGTTWGTPANFVGGQGSEQYGIQLADTGTSTLSVENALHIRGTTGRWKDINIQTGTAVGGSAHYASNGFTAVVDTDYILTFDVRVAADTGQVQVQGGGGSLLEDNLNTVFKTISYNFSTTSSSGNIRIGTGSTALNNDMIVRNISIATAAAPGTAVWTVGTLGNLQADGEYAGNWGIQLADKSSSSMSIVGNLLVAATSDGYKAIRIQTGASGNAAVGGYNTNAFLATADKEYKVEFDARVASGAAGQVRIRGNSATVGDVWQSEALTATLKTVSYTYTQASDGGRIEIDTGNTAVGVPVVITNLKIFEVPPSGGTDPTTEPTTEPTSSPDPDPDPEDLPCIELGPRTVTNVASFNQWSAIASFNISGLDLTGYKQLTWDIDAFATTAGGTEHAVSIVKNDAYGLINAFVFANGSNWGGANKVAEFDGGNLLRVVPGVRDLNAAMIAGDYSDKDSVLVVQAGNGNAGNYGTAGGGATGAKGQMTRVVINSLKLVADCKGDCSTCSTIKVPFTPVDDETVKLLMDDQLVQDLIKGATDSGVVRINLLSAENDDDGSALPKGIINAIIPNEAMSDFLKEETVKVVRIDMPDGAIDIPKEALESILKLVDGEDITLTINQVAKDDLEDMLTEEQLKGLPEGAAVFEITLFAGETQIEKFEGFLRIWLPWSGQLPATVWLLNTDGTLSARTSPTGINVPSGWVVFDTPSLSIYIIRHSPGSTTDNTGVVTFLGIAGVLLVTSGAGTVVIARKLRRK